MPYIERVDQNGNTEKEDRYYTTERKKKQNSAKAAAKLRQLLKAEEKDIQKMNLEFGYATE